jgi:LAO/AO transport system kinase
MNATDQALVDAVLGPPGPAQRRAVAKAVTLLESSRDDHRPRADALLNALLPSSGKAFRLGVSGVPGVGKSTFIEALGLHLVEAGHRVAVLAIDPSSSLSGGSILGDKTRMERLSVHERAYIRPSPASGTLGGVAEKTRESMLVCEAAGHDVVIIETVGVGQSETAVAGMTDVFALLQLPNAGDDLQAIKRGVMEMADVVVINKADIDAAAATRAEAQLTSALRLLHRKPPPVLQASALNEDGIEAFWRTVCELREGDDASGALQRRRHEQDRAWMWGLIEAGLRTRFRTDARVREALPRMTADVDAGRVAPSVAARQLLDLARP